MECSNCGTHGHSFRDCAEPVTSFGVIAFRHGPCAHALGQLEFLLIRRKDSLGYVELLRGKYAPDNMPYVTCLLNQCTLQERERLRTQPFDALWDALWSHQNTRQYRCEHEAARAKFEVLRGGEGRLEAALASCEDEWLEPEWGLPKGRRNTAEAPLSCAVREFAEETGLPQGVVQVVRNLGHLQEEYMGTNGVRYRHRYFLGRCDGAQAVCSDPNNAVQQREVSAAEWLPLEECLRRIRPTNEAKREVLRKAVAILQQYAVLLSTDVWRAGDSAAASPSHRSTYAYASASAGDSDGWTRANSTWRSASARTPSRRGEAAKN